MRFKVLPRGMKSDDARWTLDIDDNRLRVIDAIGQTLADWEGAAILEGVLTPSFWQNRKGYGLALNGQSVDFDATADVRRELQALLDRAYVRKYPAAATNAALFGLGLSGFGVALLVAAVAVTVISNQDENGSGLIWTGGILVGAVLAVQGLYRAAGTRKWRRLADELRARDERDRAARAGAWDYLDHDEQDSIDDDRGEK